MAEIVNFREINSLSAIRDCHLYIKREYFFLKLEEGLDFAINDFQSKLAEIAFCLITIGPMATPA